MNRELANAVLKKIQKTGSHVIPSAAKKLGLLVNIERIEIDTSLDTTSYTSIPSLIPLDHNATKCPFIPLESCAASCKESSSSLSWMSRDLANVVLKRIQKAVGQGEYLAAIHLQKNLRGITNAVVSFLSSRSYY